MEDLSWARGVRRVTAFTGAGISTDSGVPDYRGPQGLWTKDPAAADIFTYDRFLADAEVRRRFWEVFSGRQGEVQPNVAHRALADLEASGSAVRIVTQNVDGLHQKAGSSPRKVVELHGSLTTASCLDCGARTTAASALAQLPAEPLCGCGGPLKPSIVMFGEYLDSDVLSQARRIAAASELFLVVGTTLQVEPAASLCGLAVDLGARLVIVNRDPTPYDDLATAVIRTPIGEAVPAICAELMA
ncbi:Sir2 family NAD-dependent protein deacetylase [Actinocorallia sp. A-T 12471]|uniref:SIR2 family NAD-dependent protein deacylase n=1 Tax=Actinocorallia sp. A-T 12471 TaxID=3089813 RepID=UPI0029CFAD6C|nr:Sir2 family NAD-dependent protein deacetylase [Actinocorallia sp. A-T 12471]MDX6739600.1 Sir2 family NAD-dependent protein deacetylase [Actinocorallia sp. A-T 12471]